MRVGLFVTCLIDMMRPDIGFSTLKLLESAGCDVVVPQQQTCCGQPGYNAGDRKSARALAEKCITEFESCDYVVVPSGSCGGMIHGHYAELFADAPSWQGRAQQLASRTYELTDFLVNIAKIDLLPSRASAHPKLTATYHDSCSGLRELGIEKQPRKLLAKLPHVSLVEMKDSHACCGFGGTFAVKYGDISCAIVDDKCANIHACGAESVVMGDLGCMLHIEGRLRRSGDEKTRVLHIAQVLAGDQ